MANIDNIVDGKRTIGEKILLTGLGLTALVGTYFTNPDYKNLDIGVKSVYAEEKQYKTVDDILAPIKNKVFVNKDTYEAEVAKSDKAVVFFYEGNDVDGPNGRLANIYARTINQFPNIRIICYDHDKENMPNLFYLNSFGFKGTPHTFIFVNGKNIFENEGAPKKENVQKAIKIWQNNFQEVSQM